MPHNHLFFYFKSCMFLIIYILRVLIAKQFIFVFFMIIIHKYIVKHDFI